MSTIQMFLRNALIALALFGSAGAAVAGPSYHVSLDTRALAGNGFLDLYFSRQADAPQSMVTVSNFSGAYGSQEFATAGVSGAIPGSVEFGSVDGDEELMQNVSFGGFFGFDVGFSGDFASTVSEISSLFGIALFDANSYLLADGDLIQFSLVPTSTDGAPGGVSVETFGAAAAVTELVDGQVPEPSALLLMLTGLAFAGFSVRRKQKSL